MKTKTRKARPGKTRSIVFFLHLSPPKRTMSEYHKLKIVGPYDVFTCYIRGQCSPLDFADSLALARPSKGEMFLNAVKVKG